MRLGIRALFCALLGLVCVIVQPVAHGQMAVPGLHVEKTSIGGGVNASGGKPEAGVWVIAETKLRAVPFRKIVVTDDQGRFLVPDLPDSSYRLWVRSYGLKDSDPVDAAMGSEVKLQVANAASLQVRPNPLAN